jgi:hypothetical protein
MSLPTRQQRTLDGIDHGLRMSDPDLTRMFAVFTRLAAEDRPAGDQPVLPERLTGSRFSPAGGLRSVILLPLLFAMLLTGLALTGNSHGAPACGGTGLTAFTLRGGVLPAKRQPACPHPASCVTGRRGGRC